MRKVLHSQPMDILLVAIGALQILFLGGLVAAVALLPRWFARIIADQKREIAETARQFIESPADDQPSPLASLTDQLATLFAARLWQHVEARVRGANGALTRDMNKAEGEAIQSQIAAQNPLLGALYAFLPKKLRAMVSANPQFLAGMGGAAKGNNGAKDGDSVQGRLKNLA